MIVVTSLSRTALRGRRSLLFSALALALGGCGGPPDAAGAVALAAAPANAAELSSAARPLHIHDSAVPLQACAYSGEALSLPAGDLRLAGNADGRQVVAEIMRYTGLPQNFEVMEHPKVPNAAAVILLGEDALPKRVIAYNPDFIREVRQATGDNRWAPISIMAHEIGHHLSGHTILPGGSQPPTELEADKFSGFVLYKMGARLDDAQQAMNTLVPEADGPTHPGRDKRVRAIADGWTQACTQQSADCSAAGMVTQALTVASTSPVATTAPPASSPVAPVEPQAGADAPVGAGAARVETAIFIGQGAGVSTPATSSPSAPPAVRLDQLPLPDARATPGKFDRFIYDELGVLDGDIRARFERQMFDHARQHGVEIVTLLVRDLHGLSGDDYAQAMLRQLRVGKLDVGNGAVLVVAPGQHQVGLAMGPGVALAMEFQDKEASLQDWLDTAWPFCQQAIGCTDWTENLLAVADHIRRDTSQLEWQLRYSSLDELMAAFDTANAALLDNPAGYDPDSDPSNGKIVRLAGDVIDLAPVDSASGRVLDSIAERGFQPVRLAVEGGYTVMLYLHPRLPSLMPAGPLQTGQRYQFIARAQSLSGNREDTQSFYLLSYDAAPTGTTAPGP